MIMMMMCEEKYLSEEGARPLFIPFWGHVDCRGANKWRDLVQAFHLS
jgi:hypothetical protein